MTNLKNSLVLLSISLLFCHSALAKTYREISVTQKNTAIFPDGILTCEASDYAWGGSVPGNNEKHEKTLSLSKNSVPFPNKILIKSEDKNKVMIDNEEFRIIKFTENELFAVYLDEKNVLTVQIIFKTGAIVYSKAYSGFPIKNNFMGYVGSCKNTIN